MENRKFAYPLPQVDWKKKRPSKTLPDQSMSIQEIVKRFVRGIPVDVPNREAVYIDQSEDDLEKLSRMDFAEKAEYARQLGERANEMRSEMAEAVRRSKEEREKAESEAASKGSETPAKPEKSGAPAPQA